MVREITPKPHSQFDENNAFAFVDRLGFLIAISQSEVRRGL